MFHCWIPVLIFNRISCSFACDERRKRIGHASLETVIRQRQEWMRHAVEHIIANRPLDALQLYAKHGALHVEKHRSAAIERLVSDYGKLPSAELPRAIAITSTRDEARRINQAMQQKRKAKRELSLTSLRLPNGDRVHKRDRVMFTVNDYRLGVRNGFLGTVTGIHRTRGIIGPGSITVALDTDEKRGLLRSKRSTVTIDLKRYPDVALGYAATAHKVQGITVRQSFVYMGDAMLSREMAFTQLSRASHETTLYAIKPVGNTALEHLAMRLSKDTSKDLAHDHTIHTQRRLTHDRSQSL